VGTMTVPPPVRGVLGSWSRDASGAGVDAHATVVGKRRHDGAAAAAAAHGRAVVEAV
jgi:hypothetical protein